MTRSAFLPINFLPPRSLLLRIHAIPNRSRSRSLLLCPPSRHRYNANRAGSHVRAQHRCAPSRQPTILCPQLSASHSAATSPISANLCVLLLCVIFFFHSACKLNAIYSPEYAPPLTATTMY